MFVLRKEILVERSEEEQLGGGGRTGGARRGRHVTVCVERNVLLHLPVQINLSALLLTPTSPPLHLSQYKY